MKKSVKIVLILLLLILLGVVGFFAVAFCGNPVSHVLARVGANIYLSEEWDGTDYTIEKVGYNFKDGNYYARLTSPTTIDGDFTMYMNGWGRYKDDTYGSVTDGWNTYRRLESDYRELVKSVLEREDFPIESDIDFGTLPMYAEWSGFEWDPPLDYGIVVEELVVNGEYDIRELGKENGCIVFYAYDETITAERAGELMLLLKEELDKANVPFHAMDFVLELPRRENGTRNNDAGEIRVENFKYADIYPEGMTERVQKAHDELEAIYAAVDAKGKFN